MDLDSVASSARAARSLAVISSLLPSRAARG